MSSLIGWAYSHIFPAAPSDFYGVVTHTLAWCQNPETGSGDVAFTNWAAQVKMQKYIFGTHFATCNNIHFLPGV